MGVEWQSSIAESDYDRGYAATIALDGGYVVAGYTNNQENQSDDILLSRFDLRGNLLWQELLGAAGDEYALAIVSDDDGGYTVAGHTDSKGMGGRDFWLVKVDAQGKILWDKTYGDRFEDKARDLIRTSDGGYLLAGYKMIKSSSNIDGWVLKLDGAGEMEWEANISGHFRNYIKNVAEVEDGYLLAGHLEPSSGSEFKDDMGRLIKLDLKGKVVWDKIVGGEEEDQMKAVVPLDNGDFYAVGYTESEGKGRTDIWVQYYNRKGDEQWSKTWGDIGADEPGGATLDDRGQLVLAGFSNSRESQSNDAIVLCFGKEGNLEWSEQMGEALNEQTNAVLTTEDGGFLLIGESCTHYQYNSEPVKCSMTITKLWGIPSRSIEIYVEKKVEAWAQRGEFEKSDAFAKRVTPEHRKQAEEKHRAEATAYYAAQRINLDEASLQRYDADRERFTLLFPEVGAIGMSIPIDGAQPFKEAWRQGEFSFEHPHFALVDDRFVLSSLDLVIQGKVYSYDHQKSDAGFVKTGERESAAPSDGSLFRGGGDPLKGLNVSASVNAEHIGKYYALIVGIDHYKGHWPPLQNAVRDAQGVELMLKKKYRFDHFKTLYDEQATRANIVDALYWLVEHVKPEDNVLIYYSGHGDYNKKLDKGYWVPVDAQTPSLSVYLSNSDLQTFLKGIDSKHTLLVADACFSGDIFRGNTVGTPFEESEKYYKEVAAIKSRQAITSGGLEPVMDGGQDGHSVFAYYFLRTLNGNTGRYLDASQLFEKLKIPVVNNSEQTPSLQPIKNTGDEGGQFLFIRK